MNIPGFTAEFSLSEFTLGYANARILSASSGVLQPQARNIGGGLSNEGDCVGRYMKCVIGCYDKGTDFLEGCLDSCRASLNLCQSPLGNSRAQVLRIG